MAYSEELLGGFLLLPGDVAAIDRLPSVHETLAHLRVCGLGALQVIAGDFFIGLQVPVKAMKI